MRFTREQIRSAKYHLQEAADSAQIANWRSIEQDVANPYHADWMISDIKKAAAVLGYSFEPLPVTSQPGLDGRDDRSIGMKEADVI